MLVPVNLPSKNTLGDPLWTDRISAKSRSQKQLRYQCERVASGSRTQTPAQSRSGSRFSPGNLPTWLLKEMQSEALNRKGWPHPITRALIWQQKSVPPTTAPIRAQGLDCRREGQCVHHWKPGGMILLGTEYTVHMYTFCMQFFTLTCFTLSFFFFSSSSSSSLFLF